MLMSRLSAAGFFVALLAVLCIQFRGPLSPGHSLYVTVIEDPAARLSFFPWDLLSARELRAGHFPLWNAYSGTGMPLLGNMQSSALFPLKWLYFICPDPRSLDLMVILRLGLAGLFTMLFSRRLGMGGPGAWLSGAAFALSGYMTKHANMVNVGSEMWLPLILLVMVEARRRGPGLKPLLAGGLLFFLVLSGGSPEAAFYVCLFCFFFGLVVSMGRPGKAGFMAAVFLGPLVLASILSSIELLPFFEYLGRGFHIHGPGLHEVVSFPARLVFTLAAPWSAGPSGATELHKVSMPYVGSLCLVLGLSALLHKQGRDRYVLFFAGAAAVLLSLVLELPGLGSIAHAWPFNRLGNIKFGMAGASFSIAMLAGSGLEAVLHGRLKASRFIPAALTVALMIAGGYLHARLSREGPWLPGIAIPSAFLLAGAVLILLAGGSRSRGARGALCIITVLLAGGELLSLCSGFEMKSEVDPAAMKYKAPAVPEELKPVAADPGMPRFTGIKGAFHHNINIIFKLFDVRAFEGIYPERYVRAMGEIEGFGMDRAVESFFSHGWSFDVSEENLGHWLVDRMGIKYAVSEEPLEVPGFELLDEQKRLLYLNRQAWPRAFMAGADDPARPGARVWGYTWDRADIEAERGGDLVLADTFFPGWRAYVNAKELRIHPQDGLFRKVSINEAGRVIMTYEPWSFKLGLWISVTCIIVTAAFAWFKATRVQRCTGDADDK